MKMEDPHQLSECNSNPDVKSRTGASRKQNKKEMSDENSESEQHISSPEMKCPGTSGWEHDTESTSPKMKHGLTVHSKPTDDAFTGAETGPSKPVQTGDWSLINVEPSAHDRYNHTPEGGYFCKSLCDLDRPGPSRDTYYDTIGISSTTKQRGRVDWKTITVEPPHEHSSAASNQYEQGDLLERHSLPGPSKGKKHATILKRPIPDGKNRTELRVSKTDEKQISLTSNVDLWNFECPTEGSQDQFPSKNQAEKHVRFHSKSECDLIVFCDARITEYDSEGGSGSEYDLKIAKTREANSTLGSDSNVESVRKESSPNTLGGATPVPENVKSTDVKDPRKTNISVVMNNNTSSNNDQPERGSKENSAVLSDKNQDTSRHTACPHSESFEHERKVSEETKQTTDLDRLTETPQTAVHVNCKSSRSSEQSVHQESQNQTATSSGMSQSHTERMVALFTSMHNQHTSPVLPPLKGKRGKFDNDLVVDCISNVNERQADAWNTSGTKGVVRMNGKTKKKETMKPACCHHTSKDPSSASVKLLCTYREETNRARDTSKESIEAVLLVLQSIQNILLRMAKLANSANADVCDEIDMLKDPVKLKKKKPPWKSGCSKDKEILPDGLLAYSIAHQVVGQAFRKISELYPGCATRLRLGPEDGGYRGEKDSTPVILALTAMKEALRDLEGCDVTKKTYHSIAVETSNSLTALDEKNYSENKLDQGVASMSKAAVNSILNEILDLATGLGHDCVARCSNESKQILSSGVISGETHRLQAELKMISFNLVSRIMREAVSALLKNKPTASSSSMHGGKSCSEEMRDGITFSAETISEIPSCKLLGEKMHQNDDQSAACFIESISGELHRLLSRLLTQVETVDSREELGAMLATTEEQLSAAMEAAVSGEYNTCLDALDQIREGEEQTPSTVNIRSDLQSQNPTNTDQHDHSKQSEISSEERERNIERAMKESSSDHFHVPPLISQDTTAERARMWNLYSTKLEPQQNESGKADLIEQLSLSKESTKFVTLSSQTTDCSIECLSEMPAPDSCGMHSPVQDFHSANSDGSLEYSTPSTLLAMQATENNRENHISSPVGFRNVHILRSSNVLVVTPGYIRMGGRNHPEHVQLADQNRPSCSDPNGQNKETSSNTYTSRSVTVTCGKAVRHNCLNATSVVPGPHQSQAVENVKKKKHSLSEPKLDFYKRTKLLDCAQMRKQLFQSPDSNISEWTILSFYPTRNFSDIVAPDEDSDLDEDEELTLDFRARENSDEDEVTRIMAASVSRDRIFQSTDRVSNSEDDTKVPDTQSEESFSALSKTEHQKQCSIDNQIQEATGDQDASHLLDINNPSFSTSGGLKSELDQSVAKKSPRESNHIISGTDSSTQTSHTLFPCIFGMSSRHNQECDYSRCHCYLTSSSSEKQCQCCEDDIFTIATTKNSCLHAVESIGAHGRCAGLCRQSDACSSKSSLSHYRQSALNSLHCCRSAKIAETSNTCSPCLGTAKSSQTCDHPIAPQNYCCKLSLHQSTSDSIMEAHSCKTDKRAQSAHSCQHNFGDLRKRFCCGAGAADCSGISPIGSKDTVDHHLDWNDQNINGTGRRRCGCEAPKNKAISSVRANSMSDNDQLLHNISKMQSKLFESMEELKTRMSLLHFTFSKMQAERESWVQERTEHGHVSSCQPPYDPHTFSHCHNAQHDLQHGGIPSVDRYTLSPPSADRYTLSSSYYTDPEESNQVTAAATRQESSSVDGGLSSQLKSSVNTHCSGNPSLNLSVLQSQGVKSGSLCTTRERCCCHSCCDVTCHVCSMPTNSASSHITVANSDCSHHNECPRSESGGQRIVPPVCLERHGVTSPTVYHRNILERFCCLHAKCGDITKSKATEPFTDIHCLCENGKNTPFDIPHEIPDVTGQCAISSIPTAGIGEPAPLNVSGRAECARNQPTDSEKNPKCTISTSKKEEGKNKLVAHCCTVAEVPHSVLNTAVKMAEALLETSDDNSFSTCVYDANLCHTEEHSEEKAFLETKRQGRSQTETENGYRERISRCDAFGAKSLGNGRRCTFSVCRNCGGDQSSLCSQYNSSSFRNADSSQLSSRHGGHAEIGEQHWESKISAKVNASSDVVSSQSNTVLKNSINRHSAPKSRFGTCASFLVCADKSGASGAFVIQPVTFRRPIQFKHAACQAGNENAFSTRRDLDGQAETGSSEISIPRSVTLSPLLEGEHFVTAGTVHGRSSPSHKAEINKALVNADHSSCPAFNNPYKDRTCHKPLSVLCEVDKLADTASGDSCMLEGVCEISHSGCEACKQSSGHAWHRDKESESCKQPDNFATANQTGDEISRGTPIRTHDQRTFHIQKNTGYERNAYDISARTAHATSIKDVCNTVMNTASGSVDPMVERRTRQSKATTDRMHSGSSHVDANVYVKRSTSLSVDFGDWEGTNTSRCSGEFLMKTNLGIDLESENFADKVKDEKVSTHEIEEEGLLHRESNADEELPSFLVDTGFIRNKDESKCARLQCEVPSGHTALKEDFNTCPEDKESDLCHVFRNDSAVVDPLSTDKAHQRIVTRQGLNCGSSYVCNDACAGCLLQANVDFPSDSNDTGADCRARECLGNTYPRPAICAERFSDQIDGKFEDGSASLRMCSVDVQLHSENQLCSCAQPDTDQRLNLGIISERSQLLQHAKQSISNTSSGTDSSVENEKTLFAASETDLTFGSVTFKNPEEQPVSRCSSLASLGINTNKSTAVSSVASFVTVSSHVDPITSIYNPAWFLPALSRSATATCQLSGSSTPPCSVNSTEANRHREVDGSMGSVKHRLTPAASLAASDSGADVDGGLKRSKSADQLSSRRHFIHSECGDVWTSLHLLNLNSRATRLSLEKRVRSIQRILKQMEECEELSMSAQHRPPQQHDKRLSGDDQTSMTSFLHGNKSLMTCDDQDLIRMVSEQLKELKTSTNVRKLDTCEGDPTDPCQNTNGNSDTSATSSSTTTSLAIITHIATRKNFSDGICPDQLKNAGVMASVDRVQTDFMSYSGNFELTNHGGVSACTITGDRISEAADCYNYVPVKEKVNQGVTAKFSRSKTNVGDVFCRSEEVHAGVSVGVQGVRSDVLNLIDNISVPKGLCKSLSVCAHEVGVDAQNYTDPLNASETVSRGMIATNSNSLVDVLNLTNSSSVAQTSCTEMKFHTQSSDTFTVNFADSTHCMQLQEGSLSFDDSGVSVEGGQVSDGDVDTGEYLMEDVIGRKGYEAGHEQDSHALTSSSTRHTLVLRRGESVDETVVGQAPGDDSEYARENHSDDVQVYAEISPRMFSDEEHRFQTYKITPQSEQCEGHVDSTTNTSHTRPERKYCAPMCQSVERDFKDKGGGGDVPCNPVELCSLVSAQRKHDQTDMISSADHIQCCASSCSCSGYARTEIEIEGEKTVDGSSDQYNTPEMTVGPATVKVRGDRMSVVNAEAAKEKLLGNANNRIGMSRNCDIIERNKSKETDENKSKSRINRHGTSITLGERSVAQDKARCCGPWPVMGNISATEEEITEDSEKEGDIEPSDSESLSIVDCHHAERCEAKGSTKTCDVRSISSHVSLREMKVLEKLGRVDINDTTSDGTCPPSFSSLLSCETDLHCSIKINSPTTQSESSATSESESIEADEAYTKGSIVISSLLDSCAKSDFDTIEGESKVCSSVLESSSNRCVNSDTEDNEGLHDGELSEGISGKPSSESSVIVEEMNHAEFVKGMLFSNSPSANVTAVMMNTADKDTAKRGSSVSSHFSTHTASSGKIQLGVSKEVSTGGQSGRPDCSITIQKDLRDEPKVTGSIATRCVTPSPDASVLQQSRVTERVDHSVKNSGNKSLSDTVLPLERKHQSIRAHVGSPTNSVLICTAASCPESSTAMERSYRGARSNGHRLDLVHFSGQDHNNRNESEGVTACLENSKVEERARQTELVSFSMGFRAPKRANHGSDTAEQNEVGGNLNTDGITPYIAQNTVGVQTSAQECQYAADFCKITLLSYTQKGMNTNPDEVKQETDTEDQYQDTWDCHLNCKDTRSIVKCVLKHGETVHRRERSMQKEENDLHLEGGENSVTQKQTETGTTQGGGVVSVGERAHHVGVQCTILDSPTLSRQKEVMHRDLKVSTFLSRTSLNCHDFRTPASKQPQYLQYQCLQTVLASLSRYRQQIRSLERDLKLEKDLHEITRTSLVSMTRDHSRFRQQVSQLSGKGMKQMRC